MSVDINHPCIINAMNFVEDKHEIKTRDSAFLSLFENEFNCKLNLDTIDPFCVSGELIFKNNNHETVFLLKWS